MTSDNGVPEVSIPSEADLKQLPEEERLMQAAQAAEGAASAQGMVDSLKSKAALLTDPKKREKVLLEAFDREVEARGLSKKARVLKSGTFQGAAGGAGIGAATGVGLGTVVGTLVGTVASVPTTALGGLVGAGTGAIHGPWIKLGGGSKKEGDAKEERTVQVPQEAFDSGAVQLDDKTGQLTLNDPEALDQAVAAEHKMVTRDTGERRKPKKLEIRSDKQAAMGKTKSLTDTNTNTRRKPPKLEVRPKQTQ